jgi:hypothetical protein
MRGRHKKQFPLSERIRIIRRVKYGLQEIGKELTLLVYYRTLTSSKPSSYLPNRIYLFRYLYFNFCPKKINNVKNQIYIHIIYNIHIVSLG